MWRILRAIFALVMILFALITGILVAVRSRPDAGETALVLPCGQTCWHGIDFGESSVDEAAALLRADDSVIDVQTPRPDFAQGCSITWTIRILPGWRGCSYTVESRIANIRLYPLDDFDQSLELGQIMAALGSPQQVSICRDNYYNWQAALFYTNNIVVFATDFHPFAAPVFSRTMPVSSIYYSFSYDNVRPTYWQGFRDWGRYKNNQATCPD